MPLFDLYSVNPALYSMVCRFRGYSGVANGEVLEPGSVTQVNAPFTTRTRPFTRAEELEHFILARSALRTPSTRSVTLRQLHNIFGHQSVESLITAVQQGFLAGFKISDLSSRKTFACEACKRARGVLLPITKATRYRAHRFFVSRVC